jgi:hypothetical protein
MARNPFVDVVAVVGTDEQAAWVVEPGEGGRWWLLPARPRSIGRGRRQTGPSVQ